MAIRPLLLGHRGARAEKSILENTLASFDWALAHGCDGFEFDVQLSADHQPVICHDATFQGLAIAQCSAKELDLPLLRDVLKRYQTTAFLDIELKVTGLEAIAVDLIRACIPQRGYVISSFLVEAVQAIHRMDPAIPAGLICETRAEFRLWPTLLVEYVIPQQKLLTHKAITELKRAGKKILVWTVNSTKGMQRFAASEVDGIISDNPQRLSAVIAGR